MAERASGFTAQEFIDKLQRNEITASLVITGMVKLPDTPSTGLLFAPGTRCAQWILIPTNAIERVEILEVVPCDEHTHPLVNLTLKTPESTEGAMLASLLSAVGKPGVATPAMPSTNPTPTRARLVTRTSGVGLFKSGCAAACTQYEVDEGGHIYELYSCKDYGAGIAICYYH